MNHKQEIALLEAKIKQLQVSQAQEAAQRNKIKRAHGELIRALKRAGVSLDQYIELFEDDYKRAINKRIRASAASGRRGRPKKAVIKIPAGVYGNIPGAGKQRITVNVRGPRPELLKAYAEQVGIDAFLKKCKVQ